MTKPLAATEAHAIAFKALAQPARLKIFFWLVRVGREAPVGEIQKVLGIPGATLFHHLELLRRAGLVKNRKEERFAYCSVNRPVVSGLVRLLTSCC